MKFTNPNLCMSQNQRNQKKNMENPANLHQNLFQMVLSGRTSWNLTGGVHQRKVLSHQIFPVQKVKRKNYQKFHTCWLSVREPMIGFRKKKSNFRTKDANGKNGGVFFSRWDPFSWKLHPSKTKSKKNPETWWQRPSKKNLIGGQKAHFQGRSCRFREASSKMTRTLKSKK